MKKLLTALLIVSAIGFVSCQKGNLAKLNASMTISGLDSSKVALLDSTRIDSIVRVQAPGYFVSVDPGVPVSIYKRMLIIRYYGTPSDYRVIYTGDAGH